MAPSSFQFNSVYVSLPFTFDRTLHADTHSWSLCVTYTQCHVAYTHCARTCTHAHAHARTLHVACTLFDGMRHTGRPLRENRLEVDLHTRPANLPPAPASDAPAAAAAARHESEVTAQTRLVVRCGTSGEPVKMYSPAVWPCWVCDVSTCESTGPNRTKGPLNPMYAGDSAIIDDWGACEACYQKLSDPTNLDVVVSKIAHLSINRKCARRH